MSIGPGLPADALSGIDPAAGGDARRAPVGGFPGGGRRRLGWIALVVAVGLAFADASIVALALPDLYGEFEATIPGVSWVLTAYALAVAVVGFALVPLARRVPAAVLTGAGAAVFAGASVASGAAPTLPALVVARTVQGAGAAGLVTGSYLVLVALAGDRVRAGRSWALAGTVGAVVGPAVGGLVTQLWDWRVVFLVQAPIAAGAIAAAVVAGVGRPAGVGERSPAGRPDGVGGAGDEVGAVGRAGDGVGPARPGEVGGAGVGERSPVGPPDGVGGAGDGVGLAGRVGDGAGRSGDVGAGGSVARSTVRRPRGALVADVALALTFGGLVGALFLGVLLLVVIWGEEPIVGAAVVTAMPVGTLVATLVGRALGLVGAVVAGGAALAGGLATLAFLPGVSFGWAGVALGLCGLGFGLLVDGLGPLSVPPGDGGRAATSSSAARHLGLVAGLALIAPVLAGDVLAAADVAPLPATARVLDAPVGIRDKVRIALDIRDLLAEVPNGEVPDLGPVFEANGAGDDPDVARLQQDLERDVHEVLTRSFRDAFSVAAALAAGAGLVGLVAAVRAGTSNRRVAGGAGARDDTSGGRVAGGAGARDDTSGGRVAGGAGARSDTSGHRAASSAVVRDGRSGRRAAGGAVVGVGGAGGALLVATVTAVAVAVPAVADRSGGAELGKIALVEPCTAPVDPFEGSGFDAAAQRFVLSGLYGAACELGVSREELVLSLEPRSGQGPRWDNATIERALRSGVSGAIDAADERDSIPGWLAWSLQQAVERAPVRWFLDRLGFDAA
ncbi:MAG: MFS transporter [Acidimicrobiia bacterium]